METLSEAKIDCAVASATLEGQAETGDRYLVRKTPAGLLMGVVDGLGHGAEAAKAAMAAVATLDRHAHEPLASLVRRCHERLLGTRGVVLSLASFRTIDRGLTWLGVGNVEGLLLRSNPRPGMTDRALLLRGGVVGGRLPDLQPSDLTLENGDTLVFATDGIRSDFVLAIRRNDEPGSIAEAILARHRKETDDALVLVARFRGDEP
jgi:phosphoserine phosphatase RsbX